MMKRLHRMLSSLRLTLVLISLLSFLFLLGLWIPQKDLLKRGLYLQWRDSTPQLVAILEFFGLTDIYTSPVTLTLWTLFFLNLSFVMLQRIKSVKERVLQMPLPGPQPDAVPAWPSRAEIELPAASSLNGVSGWLRKAGYVFAGTPHRFTAIKNRFSPAATLLFHLSFFLILFGGVVTFYTKFGAVIDIAEGEAFTGALDRYVQPFRMPKFGGVPDARFVVDRIQPVVEKDVPVGLVVFIRDQAGAQHRAEINRPYKTGGTSFVVQNLGVAPLVILRDDHGRELDGAYVKLNVLKGKQDSFHMAGLDFSVDFFPDHVLRDGEDATRSEQVLRPAFRLHVQKGKSFVARKTVQMGETTAFRGYRLAMPEMRYWVRFYVVKESGPGIIYAGFATATAALIWRLLFYRRDIQGVLGERDGRPVLVLAGRGEFYRALFEDEFQGLIKGLRAHCAAADSA